MEWSSPTLTELTNPEQHKYAAKLLHNTNPQQELAIAAANQLATFNTLEIEEIDLTTRQFNLLLKKGGQTLIGNEITANPGS